MKKCTECGCENGDESKFCEQCGAQEFNSMQSDSAGEVKIGDNSAVSTGEIVSGGKNNTSNTTTTDNSVTSNVIHGTSAEDMASILKVVMQENSNIIKQVLEHQQQQQQEQEVANTDVQDSTAKQGKLSSKGGAVSKDEELSEYELVAINLYNTIMPVLERMEVLKSPDKSFFLKRYHFVMWLAATVFFFFVAAATAIGIVWIAVLASLGMVIFTLFKRFKSTEVEPNRVLFESCMSDYAKVKKTIVSTFGEDNEIITLGEQRVSEATKKFEDAEQSAAKGAKVTTAVVSCLLLVLGFLVANIAIG